MDEARCGVTSQLVNGCAAHASRRLLTRHLKTCLLVTLFTTSSPRLFLDSLLGMDIDQPVMLIERFSQLDQGMALAPPS